MKKSGILLFVSVLIFIISFSSLGWVIAYIDDLMSDDTKTVFYAIPEETAEPEFSPEPDVIRGLRGIAVDLPEDVRAYIYGKSYKPNKNIAIEDLAYLTIPHYDFGYNVVEGNMIVNKSIAEEVLDIFQRLFEIKYPIERMELVDKYNADDYESIEYNNTSAFNYRNSTSGSGKLSEHAFGFAIDINPQINPYVNSAGIGSHENAEEYWSRDISLWTSDIAKAAYIGTDTEIYNIFVNEFGWEWGGEWTSYIDYQHFEKPRE